MISYTRNITLNLFQIICIPAHEDTMNVSSYLENSGIISHPVMFDSIQTIMSTGDILRYMQKRVDLVISRGHLPTRFEILVPQHR